MSTLIILLAMASSSNHAPHLFVDPLWVWQWPHPQQRAVMEEYKRTGIMKKGPINASN